MLEKYGEIHLSEKFDYIIIENHPEHLRFVKSYLKPDGKILLLTENRFGITYFAGAKGKDNMYSSICEKKENAFSKPELENLLKVEGFQNYRFYYPLPNYKIPNVIFSDYYLPDSTDTKLNYNALYERGSFVMFDELKAMKQLTENYQFAFFSNAYFVEIANQEIKDKQPQFVSFNNARKSEYQLITKIYSDEVQKQEANENAKAHIAKIQENIEHLKKLGFQMLDDTKNDIIYSRFVKQERFDKRLVVKILENDIESALLDICKWYEHIKEKMEISQNWNQDLFAKMQMPQNLTPIKDGYIDLVFENTFYVEEEFLFFDQEWYIKNIPLEYILYRSIHNLYVYHQELEKILTQEEFLKKFDLLQYCSIFEKIEDYIQNEISDKNMEIIRKESQQALRDANELSLLVSQIQDFKEEDARKTFIIQNLEKEEKNKTQYIEELKKEEENKTNYIIALENIRTNHENQIENLNTINQKKDETIQQLNEIIKVKENQIALYENMKAVKIMKKLRGKK